MKRILITGGSGFLGTNLVQYHIDQGDKVLSLDVAHPSCVLHESVWRRGDILDVNDLHRHVQEFQPTHVYHFAARTDLDGKTVGDYRANTEGVANVIDVFSRYKEVERIFFASSRLVCRIGYQPKHDRDYLPTTAYGQSKADGEELVRQSGSALHWTIVRPTSIWGEWFGVPYKDFFLTIRAGKYFHPSGPDIRKSFGYVGNSVYQLAKLLSAPSHETATKTFYIADYPPLGLRDFANKIQECFRAPRIRLAPRWVLQFAGRVGDLIPPNGIWEPPVTTFRVSNLLTDMVYDLSPVEAIVGRLPYSMEEGVRRTVTWLRSQSSSAVHFRSSATERETR
ncbi:MAG: NAD-dependent epimerase/dehydratase family protein [Gemmatimonadaceae bacterium]